MGNGLVVSTECPTCGGPLDFSEGSNAIRCPFCRSNLLVTGRKQTLSYYIAPKLVLQRAVARVLIAHKKNGRPCRVVRPELVFLPYYRLTGHDLRWEEAREKKSRALADRPAAFPPISGWTPSYRMESDLLFSAINLAGDWIGSLFSGGSSRPVQTDVHPAPETARAPSFDPSVLAVEDSPPSGRPGKRVAFIDRYVEKNFIACGVSCDGVYSLGVRPSVLRLRLFDRAVLQSQGKIVSPTVTPEDAFSRAMKTAAFRRLLYRRVLGQVLSVIYFPYWFVEIRRGRQSLLTVVDAVSERVIDLEVPPGLNGELRERPGPAAEVAGFRPLACPNCGWDLPVRPAEIIFFCASCRKAWQIHGKNLAQLSYRIAAGPEGRDPQTLRYLPFWVADIRMEKNDASRYYIPAFRYSRLKVLKDLAESFTERKPTFGSSGESTGEASLDLRGCFYDQEDAVKFAQILYIGTDSDPAERIRILDRKPPDVSGLTLAWFPFEEKGTALIDTGSGFTLSKRLLR
jgi:DNA-directed RNA polymerase subunit RPC12/RpoP